AGGGLLVVAGAALALLALGSGGCRGAAGPEAGARAEAEQRPLFTDRLRQAGIPFVQGHGGRNPLTILETVGSGCAMVDADGDGWLDLLLVGQQGVGNSG